MGPDPTQQEASTVSAESLFERIRSHSDLVGLGASVMSVAAELDCGIEDLRESIQADPVLAAQVVRRVNSPYYGLSEPIHDLRQAVSVLGFYDLRNLAIVALLARFLDQHDSTGTLNRAVYWQHSIAVATASHLLARIAGTGNPAEVFAAGVLHDFGYVLFDLYRRRHFHRVVGELTRDRPTFEVEREIMGFDHAELGARLAESWHLSPAVVDAIRYHHEPQAYYGGERESIYVLAVANYFCSRGGWTSLGIQNVPPPPDSAYAGLHLDAFALSVFWDEFPGALERAQMLADA